MKQRRRKAVRRLEKFDKGERIGGVQKGKTTVHELMCQGEPTRDRKRWKEVVVRFCREKFETECKGSGWEEGRDEEEEGKQKDSGWRWERELGVLYAARAAMGRHKSAGGTSLLVAEMLRELPFAAVCLLLRLFRRRALGWISWSVIRMIFPAECRDPKSM